MAAGATLHTFDVAVADMDRGVYEDLELRVARHPSETAAFLVTRILAYCLEYREGIAFGEGIATTDEPAVIVRDLTGAVMAWIEVGAPEADRLHYGSRLAEETTVYTHRDPAKVLARWDGKRIHRREDIVLHSLDGAFVDEVAQRLERRNRLTVTVTERHLYVEINGDALETQVADHPLG
ncbi:YaeQ family protein [Demequina sp. NBRC 110057]|uniref:YaeQ family protein n=1 Tax=Demequina sp. NBRC 110057 TaxID=1570346 RepID=UPI000A03F942|nr:YaeQ family protein [Demequina sp. NBRC 110057]